MRLTFSGRDYELHAGESVLQCMARNGVGLPSACRAGACHTCLLRARSGDPGDAGRGGLKPTLVARGYFLACQARPVTDLVVAAAGRDVITPATLAASRWLHSDVLEIRLRPQRPVDFRPGQHVTLDRGDGVIRAYSIANRPVEASRDGLEFHIRVYPDGAVSGWLARARPGARVHIGLPSGECFYLPGAPGSALLLAGTGTGIAPLLAITREALAQGHTGPVVVIHGAAEPDRLYLGERLPSEWLPGAGPRTIRWRACVLTRGEPITDVVAEELAALPGPVATRAYLCGDPGSVASMRRALFMAGMSLRDIYADEFVPAAVPG